jgi:hypothetical protein
MDKKSPDKQRRQTHCDKQSTLNEAYLLPNHSYLLEKVHQTPSVSSQFA